MQKPAVVFSGDMEGKSIVSFLPVIPKPHAAQRFQHQGRIRVRIKQRVVQRRARGPAGTAQICAGSVQTYRHGLALILASPMQRAFDVRLHVAAAANADGYARVVQKKFQRKILPCDRLAGIAYLHGGCVCVSARNRASCLGYRRHAKILQHIGFSPEVFHGRYARFAYHRSSSVHHDVKTVFQQIVCYAQFFVIDICRSRCHVQPSLCRNRFRNRYYYT